MARGLLQRILLGYPLVGRTRQRHFAGTNSQPRKLLENAHISLLQLLHALLSIFKNCVHDA